MKNTKKKNGAAAKGKGRATLSAQQTIPYLSMHPDGVCKLPGGLYTKTVEYEDINYSVASTEDQTAIFSGWSSFLNYFDSSLPFQLSFINRRFLVGPWLQRGRNPARYDHQLHSHLYSFYDKGAPHGWAGPLLWHERTFSQCHHG